MNITSINPQGFGAELLERSNPSAPPNPTLNSGDGQSNGASASPQAANGQVPPSGVAPWQRAGAQNLPPDDPTSRARAARYENLMANDGLRQRGREERRRLREEAKKKAAEEREKKRIEDLNTTAKKMFWLGIPGLPMVWLIMLIYFWKEFREPDKNEIIKKYVKRGNVLLVIYTTIIVIWFIVFQIFRNSSLKGINILTVKPQIPG